VSFSILRPLCPTPLVTVTALVCCPAWLSQLVGDAFLCAWFFQPSVLAFVPHEEGCVQRGAGQGRLYSKPKARRNVGGEGRGQGGGGGWMIDARGLFRRFHLDASFVSHAQTDVWLALWHKFRWLGKRFKYLAFFFIRRFFFAFLAKVFSKVSGWSTFVRKIAVCLMHTKAKRGRAVQQNACAHEGTGRVDWGVACDQLITYLFCLRRRRNIYSFQVRLGIFRVSPGSVAVAMNRGTRWRVVGFCSQGHARLSNMRLSYFLGRVFFWGRTPTLPFLQYRRWRSGQHLRFSCVAPRRDDLHSRRVFIHQFCVSSLVSSSHAVKFAEKYS